GNGYMGQRANFEESYSGPSMQGSYLAGIYYPDKTRVGWWKNGYPEFFAKVLNGVNWIRIDIEINGELLDLAKVEFQSFERVLDLEKGILSKSIKFKTSEDDQFIIQNERFCSLTKREIGAIQYRLHSLNFSGHIKVTSYLDFDVMNQDANYDEQFWKGFKTNNLEEGLSVTASTKKTNFQVLAAMLHSPAFQKSEIAEKHVATSIERNIKSGEEIAFEKFVALTSNFYLDPNELNDEAFKLVKEAKQIGYNALKEMHVEAWSNKWKECDIIIEGDIAAQQAIRFNIFQLYQTYSGADARLNIGPKGFTGEKYGGSTYWDTEAYCLPFYMSTASPEVARNLLVYRYKHLPHAINNAMKLGFNSGAALYPMVTMDGAECHNEWEITFEEIHRNGAIAYAIYDYTKYTGDTSYLMDQGIEVLVAIARFWKQRANFSNAKQKFVILGVTGPNEYENNVNNNWYTNYIACWCMEYASTVLKTLHDNHPGQYNALCQKLNLTSMEVEEWTKIRKGMYFPEDEERGVFLQQDNFLDKDLQSVSSIPSDESPIHEHWSWDRILRSCFIKQADVLQGLYFFEDKFDKATIKRNFDFYEPITVHESSLSPCIHAILACSLGNIDKAYEMYLRTARLDLDDYNNDADDGLHITSMAGTWMAIVKGFGGMRIKNDRLHFNPIIPEQWRSYSFQINFRNSIVKVTCTHGKTIFENLSANKVFISTPEQLLELDGSQEVEIQKLVT
ncbi:MAG: family 65 glycosyl hydrolase domain-containing protein, partial [Bacteroidota bacterium]